MVFYGTVSLKQNFPGTAYLKVNFACPNLLVRVSLHAQSYVLNISSTSSSSLHFSVMSYRSQLQHIHLGQAVLP